ncbi:MAG: multidrug effflux MFS transporter [OCS116 cluster bacterium]|nr:multidrug effflux MFS transporter [OCS116 cluster bacterium]
MQNSTPSLPKKPHIAMLIFLSALSPVALNIFIPSMPNLTQSLGTTHSIAQLTLTLYLVAFAVAQLIHGPLSDRFGRRPILLVGISIYIISSLACAFALNIEQLIIGRIFQAIGGCTGVVTTRAIVRDLYERDKAASLLGYMTMVMALAPLTSPTIGGFIDQYASWRGSFYFVSAFGIIMLFAAYKALYETNHHLLASINIAEILSKYLTLVKEKQYIGFVLGMAFSSSIFFSFIAGAPFLVTKILHLEPSVYGFYFVMVSTGYMTGNFLTGKLTRRLGSYKMFILSNIVLSIALVILLYVSYIGISQPAYIFVPMAVVACANGLAIPTAMASALSIRPEIAGTASGLAGFTQIAAGALATFIVGYFHDGTTLPMIASMVAGGALSILFFIIMVKKD